MPCAQLIGDLVPSGFGLRFPPDRFEIVLIAGTGSYNDGGATGFAMAGVAPRGRNMLPATVHTEFFQLPAPASDTTMSEAEQDYLRRAVVLSLKRLGYITHAGNLLLDDFVYSTETHWVPQKKCEWVSHDMGFNNVAGPVLSYSEECN